MAGKVEKKLEREALLMMLSAYLDGELPADDEPAVLDALSQDPALLQAFEAMSAARLDSPLSPASLTADEAEDLTASILGATAPAQIPATEAGVLELANLFVDDALDGAGRDHLDTILQHKPALAPALAGFVASTEAVQSAARAVAHIGSVVDGLAALPDQVAAQVAARERLFVLASADIDAALTPAESAELDGLLARHDEAGELLALASTAHVGEALRAAVDSPAFAQAAAKAGAAAVQAVEALQSQGLAARGGGADRAMAPAEPLLSRLWRAFAPARAPLAFAAGAAALFFVVRGPSGVSEKGGDTVATREATTDELVRELAPEVLAEAPTAVPNTDLPVLADNSADVEAIDATDTTVVFSTESSNITVIWVDADDEQGT